MVLGHASSAQSIFSWSFHSEQRLCQRTLRSSLRLVPTQNQRGAYLLATEILQGEKSPLGKVIFVITFRCLLLYAWKYCQLCSLWTNPSVPGVFSPRFTIPLNTWYIKVKHCLLLDGPIFYLHFLHDNFNSDAFSPPPLLSFPFSFPESISWFNFFSCGFFSRSLFPAAYFYFIFITAYNRELEGFLSSVAASVMPQWCFW